MKVRIITYTKTNHGITEKVSYREEDNDENYAIARIEFVGFKDEEDLRNSFK